MPDAAVAVTNLAIETVGRDLHADPVVGAEAGLTPEPIGYVQNGPRNGIEASGPIGLGNCSLSQGDEQPQDDIAPNHKKLHRLNGRLSRHICCVAICTSANDRHDHDDQHKNGPDRKPGTKT